MEQRQFRSTYIEVYNRLNTGVAVVVFFKANGDLRVMLATRNMMFITMAGATDALALLASRERKCTIDNLSIAVVDVVLGEVRAFKVGRLIAFCGVTIRTQEDLEAAVKSAVELKKRCDKLIERRRESNEIELDTVEIGYSEIMAAVNELFPVASGGGEL